MTVDLTRPAILALLPTDDQVGNPILIDGYAPPDCPRTEVGCIGFDAGGYRRGCKNS